MADDRETKRSGRRRTLKAEVLGSDLVIPRSIQGTEDEQLGALFSGSGVVEPSYDPGTLFRLWENSSALNQNVAAYVTNIDGLGYRFAPRIDLNADDSFEKVRDAIWVERFRRAEARLADATSRLGEEGAPPAEGELALDPLALMPSDEEVEKKLEQLKSLQRIEKAKLSAFLDAVSPTGSFDTLKRQTRQDREICGNAYWEVLRDRAGRLARFVVVPPTHVRCTPIDEEPVLVEEKVQVGLGFEVVRQPRFFRRYVQAVGRKLVWFKEFGDPRVVSQKTGEVYPTLAAFKAATLGRNDEAPATELVHFRIHRTGEAYGVPRWIGNLLSVLGSRAADEVNYTYFDNKAVPPLALLVSGGRLSSDSVDQIQTYLRDNIKGRGNFHSILVIEADDADADPLSPREIPTLKFEKLVDVQQGDALFQAYDERNIDKIGSSFRLPRLLRGDVRDFNRATADASLRFADEQIFEPERREFDAWFNRTILPALGITLWTYRSLGPSTRDPEKVAAIIVDLAKVGVVTPNEARELSSDVIGMDLDSLDVPWAKQPIQLTLAGFRPPEDETKGASSSSDKGTDWRPGVEEELRSLSAAGAAQAARNNALEEAAGEVPDAAARAARAALDEAAGLHGADLLEEE